MVSPTIKEICKEIARNNNLPVDVVENIITSQFKFVKDTMAKGEKDKPGTFKTIQITHLGKFAIRKKKLEYYKNKMKMSAPKGLKLNTKYSIDILNTKHQKNGH